jgi:GR25 family glycosyltransferase involved in LPS biosynthesis
MTFQFINGIDKFFYINLEERTDRNTHFLDQCCKEEIPNDKIERFNAIRGSKHNFTEKEIEMFIDANYISKADAINSSIEVAKSIMGNQLSHIKILEIMRERNYDTIVIFQDDVIFKKNFMFHISNIAKNIPEDAEIINIGMHKVAIYEYFEGLNLDDDTNHLINYLVNDYVAKYNVYDKISRCRVNPASLAYLVTKKGCENILNHFETTKIQYATDWEYNLYLQNKNIFYGSKYILCTGNPEFKSDVFVKKTNETISNMIDMNYYYTDKSAFFEIYEELFHNIKNSSKNILNISHTNDKSHSSSSYLFSKYFNNSYIFTITSAPQELLHDVIKYQKRIKTISCDGFNEIIINAFSESHLEFNLIICDGKNSCSEICTEIENYSKILITNGILIVENVTDENLDVIIQTIPDELKKYIKIKKINDTNLFIIDKTSNVYGIEFIGFFEYICNKFNISYYSDDLKLFDLDVPLVISYENDMSQNENSQFFKQTLIKKCWKYLFIGEGIKWSGVIDKINNYCNISKFLPKDKVIILSDSRDSLCCRGPKTFMNKIKNIIDDNKIIISTELFLLGHMEWSEDEIAEKIKTNPDYFWQGIPMNNYWNKNNIVTDKKYVNTGLIVGKCERIFKLFNWVKNNKYHDDQLGISSYINLFNDDVYLDYKFEIIHTTTSLVSAGVYNTEIQMKDSPTISELLGYSCYFLHIPGGNISKGQQELYKICSQVIKNCNANHVLNLYSFKESVDYHQKQLFFK